MYNGQIIKDIAESRGLQLKEVFSEAKIKEGTFYQMVGPKGNPKADKLESIANVLECSVDDFFDREINNKSNISVNGHKNQVGNGNVMVESQANEIEHLKKLLEEKENMIAEKERTIRILMNKK
jgi:transcriptional regulator with XRE-family HTH domain